MPMIPRPNARPARFEAKPWHVDRESWIVVGEFADPADGEPWKAIFGGPDAEGRAKGYAQLMNRGVFRFDLRCFSVAEEYHWPGPSADVRVIRLQDGMGRECGFPVPAAEAHRFRPGETYRVTVDADRIDPDESDYT